MRQTIPKLNSFNMSIIEKLVGAIWFGLDLATFGRLHHMGNNQLTTGEIDVQVLYLVPGKSIKFRRTAALGNNKVALHNKGTTLQHIRSSMRNN